MLQEGGLFMMLAEVRVSEVGIDIIYAGPIKTPNLYVLLLTCGRSCLGSIL